MNLVLFQLIGNVLDSNSDVTISKLVIVFVTTVLGPPMARVAKSPATSRARHGGVSAAKRLRRREAIDVDAPAAALHPATVLLQLLLAPPVHRALRGAR
eukprot:9467226-Pyramimonas_sp.AAC.1